MANPTLTSAAATTIIKNTNNCPSLPAVEVAVPAAKWCIFENATRSKFTEFSMSSMHMKMMMELRRVSTPMMPNINKATERNM